MAVMLSPIKTTDGGSGIVFWKWSVVVMAALHPQTLIDARYKRAKAWIRSRFLRVGRRWGSVSLVCGRIATSPMLVEMSVPGRWVKAGSLYRKCSWFRKDVPQGLKPRSLLVLCGPT